ncbi:MAG: hypothetical protein ABI183_00480 [Polyangiaceae bacterium]
MHRSITILTRTSSSFARAVSGVVFLAAIVGTAACSGSEDPSSQDESSALGDTSKDPGTAKSPAPPSTASNGTPTLGGDYRQLLGAWEVKGKEGPVRYAVFYDEVAKPDGHAFFADLIPSSTPTAVAAKIERATGSFGITRDFIDLQSNVAEINGAFRYGFNGPDSVTVSEPAGAITYERIPTYCDTKNDCVGQVYSHVECVGAPTCAEHGCGWSCGYGDPTK